MAGFSLGQRLFFDVENLMPYQLYIEGVLAIQLINISMIKKDIS
jgi:hypothetical protein